VNTDNPFVGLDSIKPKTEREPLLNKGEYLLEVVENKKIKTLKKGDALLRIFKVREAVGDGATPVGAIAKAKLLYMTDQWVESRIAEYIRALTGANDGLADLAFKIFGAENPAKGKLIRVRITEAESEAGRAYGRYDWRYVAEDDAKPKAKK
jgi:hypothetical protein